MPSATLQAQPALSGDPLSSSRGDFWRERRDARAKLLAPADGADRLLPAPALPGIPNAPLWLTRLPAALARPANVRLSPDGATAVVVLIPDTRSDAARQRGLSALLGSLAGGPGLRFVGLAGGAGDLDLASFRRLGDAALRKTLADHFLDIGALTGAEHAALTAPAPLPVTGLEDRALLAADDTARREIRARETVARGSLQSFRETIHLTTSLRGATAFRDFLERREARRRNDVPLSGYLAHLASLVPDAAAGAAVSYLDLARREASLDAAAVTRERDALIRRLADGLDAAALHRLTAEALAYRLGERSALSFHETLLDAAGRAVAAPSALSATLRGQASLSGNANEAATLQGTGDAARYRPGLSDGTTLPGNVNVAAPSAENPLRAYVALLRAADRLRPADLAADIARLEDAAADRLAATAVDRALWEFRRDAEVFELLFSGDVSPRTERAFAARADRLARTRDLWRRELPGTPAPPSFPSEFLAPYARRLSLAGRRRDALADRLARRLAPAGITAPSALSATLRGQASLLGNANEAAALRGTGDAARYRPGLLPPQGEAPVRGKGSDGAILSGDVNVAALVVPADWIAPLETALTARSIDHVTLLPPERASTTRPRFSRPPRFARRETPVTHPASPGHAAFRRAWMFLAIGETLTTADPIEARFAGAIPRPAARVAPSPSPLPSRLPAWLARGFRRLARRATALIPV